MKKMKEMLLKICMLIVIVPLYIWYKGICCLTLYNWFLLPLGLPTINIYQMVGIVTTISLYTTNYVFPAKRDLKTESFALLFYPIIAVLIGYVLKIMS